MIAHLVNTDVGNRGILRVYIDYRRRNFNFLEEAAELFLNNIERVLLITGFPIPPSMRAETDGPPGALAIWKAVERLGGRAEILTYPEVREALKPFGASFVENPNIDDYTLVLAVETPGRAENGKYYSMSGIEITRRAFDYAIIEARRMGIPTLAIGDGGNEAGMGNVRDLVRRHVPKGRLIASVVEADVLVTAGVSNWGAYGLLAQVSLLVGENLLQGWREGDVVRALASSGLIDGVLKRALPSVDGISLAVNEGMVELLKRIVDDSIQVME